MDAKSHTSHEFFNNEGFANKTQLTRNTANTCRYYGKCITGIYLHWNDRGAKSVVLWMLIRIKNINHVNF